jgi:16S rRNA (uracil1498-N3)-methyltransferase
MKIMDVFYTPPKHISGESIVIDGDEFHHLTKVLRKKIGDVLHVVDGGGYCYEVQIENLDKRTAHCRVLHIHAKLNEPDIELTLAQALLKNPARFDFIVEKATELGVSHIIPMTTERVIAHSAKIDRWQQIALTAMKQSARCVLPSVASLTAFDDVLAKGATYDLKLIPHEKTENSQFIVSLVALHASAKNVLLLIGPEGGFTDEEIERAIANGFLPVSLGKRRLRAEPAGIVAAAWVVGNR